MPNCGEALRLRAAVCLSGWSVAVYSRKPHAGSPDCYWANFHDPKGFGPAGPSDCPGLWISFAPAWLLAPFLEELAIHYHERLRSLRGVIACSSSSALTNRFAANRFDRQLVKRLVAAEQQLLATCSSLQVPCRILRPTLIYGQVGPYRDQNLSRLIAVTSPASAPTAGGNFPAPADPRQPAGRGRSSDGQATC
jgi:hypothetical protein